MRDHLDDARDASFTADADLAVGEAWERFEPRMRRRAAQWTDDLDEQDDLVQEALIRLWKVDPTRFDLRDPVAVRYLRNSMMNRMLDVWGREAVRGRFRQQGERIRGDVLSEVLYETLRGERRRGNVDEDGG
jgi:DNA-directed RNA polymerase specialized sigma24 family protein